VARIMTAGIKQKALASPLNQPLSWVRARLAIVALDPDVPQRIDDGALAPSDALTLAKYADRPDVIAHAHNESSLVISRGGSNAPKPPSPSNNKSPTSSPLRGARHQRPHRFATRRHVPHQSTDPRPRPRQRRSRVRDLSRRCRQPIQLGRRRAGRRVLHRTETASPQRGQRTDRPEPDQQQDTADQGPPCRAGSTQLGYEPADDQKPHPTRHAETPPRTTRGRLTRAAVRPHAAQSTNPCGPGDNARRQQ